MYVLMVPEELKGYKYRNNGIFDDICEHGLCRCSKGLRGQKLLESRVHSFWSLPPSI